MKQLLIFFLFIGSLYANNHDRNLYFLYPYLQDTYDLKPQVVAKESTLLNTDKLNTIFTEKLERYIDNQ